MRIEMTRASESRTARTREQRPNGIMDDGPSEPVQTNSEVTQPSRTTTSSSYAICMDDIPPAVPSIHNMLDKQKVWLVGSSILKHAQLEAFLRPGGLHLNLKRLNISLWWQGYSGLKLSQVEQKLKTLAKVGPAPNVILIHCGGNDFFNLFKPTSHILRSFGLASFHAYNGVILKTLVLWNHNVSALILVHPG